LIKIRKSWILEVFFLLKWLGLDDILDDDIGYIPTAIKRD